MKKKIFGGLLIAILCCCMVFLTGCSGITKVNVDISGDWQNATITNKSALTSIQENPAINTDLFSVEMYMYLSADVEGTRATTEGYVQVCADSTGKPTDMLINMSVSAGGFIIKMNMYAVSAESRMYIDMFGQRYYTEYDIDSMLEDAGAAGQYANFDLEENLKKLASDAIIKSVYDEEKQLTKYNYTFTADDTTYGNCEYNTYLVFSDSAIVELQMKVKGNLSTDPNAEMKDIGYINMKRFNGQIQFPDFSGYKDVNSMLG